MEDRRNSVLAKLPGLLNAPHLLDCCCGAAARAKVELRGGDNNNIVIMVLIAPPIVTCRQHLG